MKIRSDFVTNSSSSSFLIAQKGDISDEQKKALADAIIELVMGEKIITPDSSDDDIHDACEENYIEDWEEEVLKAAREGKSVYTGIVSFEDDTAIWSLSDIYKKAWDSLEKFGHGDFAQIDTDLRY